jgi:hypothetical protein
MIKGLAVLFGLILIALGIMGFMHSLTVHQMLLGIFHVNALHNFVHLASGIIGVWAGFKSVRAAKLFFILFGLVYIAVGVLGFFYKNEDILGLIANNEADTWLHLFLGLIFFYLGARKTRA